MRKWMALLMMVLLLCGCGAEETWETISDEPVLEAMAQPREILVELPGEVALPAMESEGQRLYVCEDYEICLQTLNGGDLDRTVRTLSGYSLDAVTVMETSLQGIDRYEFVWVSAGEEGDRLGRGVILSDGGYHYTLTVLRDADTTEKSQILWNDIFASFQLV